MREENQKINEQKQTLKISQEKDPPYLKYIKRGKGIDKPTTLKMDSNRFTKSLYLYPAIFTSKIGFIKHPNIK